MDDYGARQAAKDGEYAEAYKSWVASLSLEERERLEKKGLIEPSRPDYKTLILQSEDGEEDPRGDRGVYDGWKTEHGRVSRAKSDKPAGERPPEQYLDAVRFIILAIQDAKKPRLECDCLAYAAGLSMRQNLTITGLAKEHGITKQAVQVRVARYCVGLGMPKPAGSKPESASPKYRARNARHRKPVS